MKRLQMYSSLRFTIHILLLFIIHQCSSQSSNTTESTIPIKLGGLFYEHSAEHYAFLKAIEDVNNNPMLLDGYHLNPVVEFHTTNWIIEAVNVLSQNPTAVIAPPTSVAVKQISPLFTLTTTPLIGYSATASILSDTDIFPYFSGVIPDVSDLVGPIISVFQMYEWKQAVIIHGSGPWGHGLDVLIYAANFVDISFPITIEIPDGATQSDIETLLSGDAEIYEVYIVHVLASLRENLFAAANKLGLLKEGKAWLGTEDVATSLSNETASTIHYIQGVIGVRPKTPNTWNSNRLRDNITAMGYDMVYYAYYAYDAVVTVAHAINYRIYMEDNVSEHEPLQPRDYFGGITMKSTNGHLLAAAISTLQLPPSWMMVDALYMSGNRRKTSYELVNFVDGNVEIVGEYAWDRAHIQEYFQTFLDALSVGSLNTSNAHDCLLFYWAAQAQDATEFKQLDRLLYVHEKALTSNYIPEYQAHFDVLRLWDECYRPILGLDVTYTLSEKVDDYDMFTWKVEDKIIFSGNTSDIPVGALWKKSEPLRVLAWLIAPWGNIILPNDTADDYSGLVDVEGFLPTVWENITAEIGIVNEYYWIPGLIASDVIEMISNGEYDVALGAFTITDERSNMVNFIQQFHGGGLKILSKKPSPIGTSWMFLKPFGKSLWFASFVTIVFVAGVIYILEWDTDTFNDDDERMPFMASFVEAVTISASVLFYTHEPPKGIHTRVFVLVFQYMILVWIAAYTANMASFLTTSSDPEPQVTSFIDLYDKNTRVSTLSGGYSEQVLSTKSVDIWFLCNTTDQCVQFVSNDNADNDTSNVFVFDDVNVDYWAESSDGCELVAPGETWNSVSFAFPTTFNLIPRSILSMLDIGMIELWSNGLITHWIEQYIAPQGGCTPYILSEGSDTQPITHVNMAEMFVFVGGFSICFCCMLFCQPKIESFYKATMGNRAKKAKNRSRIHQTINNDDEEEGITTSTKQ